MPLVQIELHDLSSRGAAADPLPPWSTPPQSPPPSPPHATWYDNGEANWTRTLLELNSNVEWWNHYVEYVV